MLALFGMILCTDSFHNIKSINKGKESFIFSSGL